MLLLISALPCRVCAHHRPLQQPTSLTHLYDSGRAVPCPADMLRHAEVLVSCRERVVYLPCVAAHCSQLVKHMPCPADMLNQAEVALTAPLPHVYAATERGDNTLPLPEVGALDPAASAHVALFTMLGVA